MHGSIKQQFIFFGRAADVGLNIIKTRPRSTEIKSIGRGQIRRFYLQLTAWLGSTPLGNVEAFGGPGRLSVGEAQQLQEQETNGGVTGKHCRPFRIPHSNAQARTQPHTGGDDNAEGPTELLHNSPPHSLTHLFYSRRRWQ